MPKSLKAKRAGSKAQGAQSRGARAKTDVRGSGIANEAKKLTSDLEAAGERQAEA